MKQKSKYILDLIKKHPDILSGRKNYNNYEKRIEKNLIRDEKIAHLISDTSALDSLVPNNN